MNLVGTARCAVRAAFSGATVPPATARAGTSQRDVPTTVRFMEREHLQDSDVSWGHEPPLGSAGVPPAGSPGVPPGFRDFEFFPGGETPPEPAGETPALHGSWRRQGMNHQCNVTD